MLPQQACALHRCVPPTSLEPDRVHRWFWGRARWCVAVKRGTGPSDDVIGTLGCPPRRALAGQCMPAELVPAANPDSAAQRCEAFHYVGEACLLNQQTADARLWFQQCLDTALVFDPGSNTLDPMNEYHLARWRVKQLTTRTGASSRPGR